MVRRYLLILLLSFAGATAWSQAVKTDSVYSIGIGDYFTLHYATSAHFDSTKPYKLVVMTDASLGIGNYMLHKDLPPQTALAAIGHTGGGKWKRARDFIPPGRKSSNDLGRGDRFFDFFRDTLLTRISSQFPQPSEKIFIGHSFGGLFALYLSLREPRLFHAYHAISPSVWAQQKILLQLETAYAKADASLPANIHLYAGSLEFANRVLSTSKQFYRQVGKRDYKDLNMTMQIIQGVNHFSIRKPVLQRILSAL